MKAEELCPGDWFIAMFGTNAKPFYVIAQQAMNRVIEAGSPEWDPGSTASLDYRSIDEDFVFMGHGKLRWWRLPWMHPYKRPELA